MFFVYLFLFLGFIAICSMIAKQPAFGVILLVVGLVALVTSYQNSKEKKETIEKSVERIRKELEKLSFNVSREICLTRDRFSSEFASSELMIDTENRRIALCSFYKDDLQIIPFEELLNCEILEDIDIIRSFIGSSKSDSTLEIGMATKQIKSTIRNLSIKIETSNSDKPVIIIPLITVATDRKDFEYFKAKSAANDAYLAIVRIIRQCRGTSAYFE